MKSLNITAYTNDISKIEAIKAFLKAMKIKFEITKEQPYKKEFVEMVVEAEEEITNGKSTKLTSKEFDELWK